VATTPIKLVSGYLLVNYAPENEPYKIYAIGNVGELNERAATLQTVMQTDTQGELQMHIQIEKKQKIALPMYKASIPFRYATTVTNRDR
jgi:uncharacterized protein YlxW (UPF0749 family)